MMADNYCSILRNRIPDLWFDHPIELGLGTPFTKGDAGDDRNWKHFVMFSGFVIPRFSILLPGQCTVHAVDLSGLLWLYNTLDRSRAYF